jgi:hypothetical protein
MDGGRARLRGPGLVSETAQTWNEACKVPKNGFGSVELQLYRAREVLGWLSKKHVPAVGVKTKPIATSKLLVRRLPRVALVMAH